jgi:heme/copper-type cytochrome/quinol oxidase subunit 3
MDKEQYELRLIQLDKGIKNQKSNIYLGIIMMIFSCIIIFPLLIAGLVMISHSKSNLKAYRKEKEEILRTLEK